MLSHIPPAHEIHKESAQLSMHHLLWPEQPDATILLLCQGFSIENTLSKNVSKSKSGNPTVVWKTVLPVGEIITGLNICLVQVI